MGMAVLWAGEMSKEQAVRRPDSDLIQVGTNKTKATRGFLQKYRGVSSLVGGSQNGGQHF